MTLPALPNPAVADMCAKIVRGMSAADYSRTAGVRSTGLKHLARSPLHYRWETDHPSESTEAMRLGTMAHVALWEPDSWSERYHPAPRCKKQSNADKDTWRQATAEAAAAVAELATEEQESTAKAIAKAASAHPWVARMLKVAGVNEASVFWVDTHTDVPCKARPDRFIELPDCIIIPDLKTTTNAAPESFGYRAADLGYDLSAAHYADGLQALTGKPAVFVLIAVESEQPHGVTVQEIEAADMAAAATHRRKLLELLAACEEAGRWPGYVETLDAPARVIPLKLPRRRGQPLQEMIDV